MQKIIFTLSIILFRGLVFASNGGMRLSIYDKYYDIVQLRIDDSSEKKIYSCIGFFINDYTIMTAAHCLWNDDDTDSIHKYGKQFPKNDVYAYYTFIYGKSSPNNDPIYKNPEENKDPNLLIHIRYISLNNEFKIIVNEGNFASPLSAVYDTALIFVDPIPLVNYLPNDINRIILPSAPSAIPDIILKKPRLLTFGINGITNPLYSSFVIYDGLRNIFSYLSENKCYQILNDTLTALNNFQYQYPDIYNKIKISMNFKIADIKYHLMQLSKTPDIYFCNPIESNEYFSSSNIISTHGDSGAPLVVQDSNNSQREVAGLLSMELYFLNYVDAQNNKISIPASAVPYAGIILYNNINYYLANTKYLINNYKISKSIFSYETDEVTL